MAAFNYSLAVVIGIDAYSNGIPRLTTPVNDARRMACILHKQHDYQIELLTGTDNADQPVTGERLRALFQDDLPNRLGEEDRLLVYFAGHGVASDGDDGPSGYLVPQDAHLGTSAEMIPMTALHHWLSALPCRHMLLILDCCFAGAFRWASTRHLGLLPEVIHKERYDRYLQSPAWQTLTSAASDQKALDVLSGDAKRGVLTKDDGLHSPFALALFNALEKGEADLVPKGEHDGVITATELYMYLRDHVEIQAETQANHEQTPGLWPLNKHGKGEFIFLSPVHPLNLPPAPDLTNEMNPYRGLKSYEWKHSALFFGREDEIEELAKRVEEQPILVILGPSGVGKSSLAKAGLLLQLEKANDSNPQSYKILPPIRLTEHPLQALKMLLDDELSEDLAGHGTLPPLPRVDSLAQIIGQWAKSHAGKRLVLTIDQFEEIVTLCRDAAERNLFLQTLAEAARQQPEIFRLIVTLRSDFEPQFTKEGGPLVAFWSQARYVVPPMDIEDLRQAIECPASVRVLYFDPPELVNDLIKEVNQTPGALPLLSFTLSELYYRYVQSERQDRSLSGVDYEALGGVVGALSNQATEVYNNLDDTHRATMQRVMLRMVGVEGGELRRRVTRAELRYPAKAENERVETVLQQLVDARLLARGRDSAGGEGYVEPAHNALVLAWDRLQLWKKEAEEYLPLQRRLAQSAAEWQDARPEDKQGLLWDNNPRLPQVEETLWPTGSGQNTARRRMRWLRQVVWPDMTAPPDTKWLNSAELSFTQASVRRRATTFQRIIGITLMVMVALAGLTIFSIYQANVAATRKVEAQDLAVNAQTQALMSLATSLLPTNRNPTNIEVSRSLLMMAQGITQSQTLANPVSPRLLDEQARHLLAAMREHPIQQILPGYEGGASSLAFDPEGRWLASGSYDGTIRLSDLSDLDAEPHVLAGYEGQVLSVAFDPEGRQLASGGGDIFGGGDTAIRLWDLSDLDAEPRVLEGHEDLVRSVAFDPEGRRLASGSDDGTIRLWDLSDLNSEPRVLAGHKGRVNSVAFDPEGRWLASGSSDWTIRLWDLSDLNSEPRVLEGHESWVESVAFDPEGRWLASGSSNWTIRLWDLSDLNSEPRVLEEHEASVNSMTFDPEGRWLASGSDDRTIRLWDLSDLDAAPRVLQGHEGSVRSVAFDPEGSWLASVGANEFIGGTAIRMWNLSELDDEPHVLSAHEGVVLSVAFDPEGRWLASGSSDKTILLWDLSDLDAAPRVLKGHEDWVRSVAFDPEGRWLASGGGDFTRDGDTAIRLWDLSDLDAEPRVLEGHEDLVWSVAFAPEGRWLASGSSDETIRLWDLSDLDAKPSVLEGHEDFVKSVAFDPEGHWLASGSDDRTIRLWDLTDLDDEPRVLEGHEDWVLSVAFDPEGGWLASVGGNEFGGGDTAIRLWDLSDLNAEPRVLPGHEGVVLSVAFDPEGRWLASGSLDRTMLLWDLTDLNAEPRVLSGHEGVVLSVAFDPEGRWLASGSSDRTIRLWRTLKEMAVFACELAGRNFNWDEWQQFLPGRPYQITCPQWPVHPTVPEEFRPES